MGCTVVVGGQWGDEAKGKIAAYLSADSRVSIAARAGLGPGAGHTVTTDGNVVRFRQLPTAAVHPKKRLLLGAGVLISPQVLLDEIDKLEVRDRVGVDRRATIIDQSHIHSEGSNSFLINVVQTTKSGHGPALAARSLRSARTAEEVESLRPFLTDVSLEVNEACDRGESVLIEGTNGFLLSVLHGTYPFTVGKDTTASSAAVDIGIAPGLVECVVLVFKTFPTRVGAGEFPTEMSEEEADRLGFVEFGTVTNRRRRIGHFDFELARDATRINRPDYLAVTFVDRLDPDVAGQQTLSPLVDKFVRQVEEATGVPVLLIGTGPKMSDIIDRR